MKLWCDFVIVVVIAVSASTTLVFSKEYLRLKQKTKSIRSVLEVAFNFFISWFVDPQWKLGGTQHHLLFLNGAVWLIIAANTEHA